MKKSEDLVRLACEAMKNSYSPYSGFRVGAALRCEDGSVFVGCNIENSAFSPTCCAERTAFFKAVSEGKNKFSEIAVVGGKDGVISDFCYPCGVCRQVMREFCSEDFLIHLYDGNKIQTLSLKELLPFGFSL